MKCVSIILLSIIGHTVLAQQTVKSQYFMSYNCHQVTGCKSNEFGYGQDLYFKFDDQELHWTESIYEDWETVDIRKKTPKYIVGREDDLYTYVDLKQGSVYYIDFYREAYQTWGYGPDTSTLRSNVEKMMSMLKEQQTQKDVVDFLIEQTETRD